MPLESDSSNADDKLFVEFYAYDRDGPHKGQPYVRIVVPGDKTSVIEQPAQQHYQRRFQRQWLNFQRNAGEANLIGTPLSQWHSDRPLELTDGQLQELTILAFQSVEQVATASDGQVMRIGMGGIGIRERARAYLTSKHAQISGAEMTKQADKIAMLEAALEKLTSMNAAEPLVAAKPKGTRGGWNKGKKKVRANVQHNDAPAGAAGL